jgi:hypothetical protein
MEKRAQRTTEAKRGLYIGKRAYSVTVDVVKIFSASPWFSVPFSLRFSVQ